MHYKKQKKQQKTLHFCLCVFIQRSITVLYKPFFYQSKSLKREKFGRTESVILNYFWDVKFYGNFAKFSCNCHNWCWGWLIFFICWSRELGRTWIRSYLEPSWVLKSFVAPPRGSAVRWLASQVFWLVVSCIGILSFKFEKIFCQEAFFLRISLFHEW